MNMNIIEASGLDKRYGRTWALRECTLAIPAGHVAALVGPNGAGKTTLLNLAASWSGWPTTSSCCHEAECRWPARSTPARGRALPLETGEPSEVTR